VLEAARSEPRYTREDLVSEAQRAGFRAGKRLIADWVAVGLLDKGTPRGRGRGKGKQYLWSEHQRGLMLTLLGKQGTVRRPVLCNLPVAVWLLYGDALVPLRQARRALATWASQYGTASWGAAQRTARDVLAQLDHPTADPADRQRLLDVVAKAGYSGTVDNAELSDRARRVFDPHRTGLTRGPLGLIDSDHYVKTVTARVHALQRLSELPDAAFRQAQEDYRRIGPAAALDISGSSISAEALGQPSTTLERATNNACLDLLTLLGLNLDRRQEQQDPTLEPV
jgi:hypothetical protein